MAKKFDSRYSHIETDGADLSSYSVQNENVPTVQLTEDGYSHRDFVHLMPADLQQENIDALIVCAEEDLPAAKSFEEHLANDIRYKFGDKFVKPKVELLWDICGTESDFLEKTFERSTYTFLYMTKSFCQEQLLLSHACLINTLKDPNKKWSVIPVNTQRKNKRDYSLPFLLQALKSIEYLRVDQFYKEAVVDMFSKKAAERLRREVTLDGKRKEYFDKYKEKLISMVEVSNSYSEGMHNLGIEVDSPVVGRASHRSAYRDTPSNIPSVLSRPDQSENIDHESFPDNQSLSVSESDYDSLEAGHGSSTRSNSNYSSYAQERNTNSDRFASNPQPSSASFHTSLNKNDVKISRDTLNSYLDSDSAPNVHYHIIIQQAKQVIIGDNGQNIEKIVENSEKDNDESDDTFSEQEFPDDLERSSSSTAVESGRQRLANPTDFAHGSDEQWGLPDLMTPASVPPLQNETEDSAIHFVCDPNETKVKYVA